MSGGASVAAPQVSRASAERCGERLQCGVIVRCVNLTIDETKEGHDALMSALQKAETDNHSRSNKIASSTKKKRTDGKWSGMPPFGFECRQHHGTLIVNAARMEIVRYVFGRWVDGIPQSELVRELVTRFGLKRMGGKRWHPNRITAIVRNRT